MLNEARIPIVEIVQSFWIMKVTSNVVVWSPVLMVIHSLDLFICLLLMLWFRLGFLIISNTCYLFIRFLIIKDYYLFYKNIFDEEISVRLSYSRIWRHELRRLHRNWRHLWTNCQLSKTNISLCAGVVYQNTLIIMALY